MPKARSTLPYVVYADQRFDDPSHLTTGQGFLYLLHEGGGQIVDSISLRRLNPGVVLNIHLGKSGGAIPLDDGASLDLTGYNFNGDIFVSIATYVGAAGTGQTYGTFVVALNPAEDF